MKNSTFHIGELSNLFNISVDSIRYYEKKGLIHPERNETNGYREYSLDDFQTLVMIRELLGLDFHQDQISSFLKERNISTTMEMLDTELLIIDEKIGNLQKKKNQIIERLQSLQTVQKEAVDNMIQLKTFKKRPIVMISTKNLPDAYVDYTLVQYMKKEQIKLNTIGFCDCYTLDLENSNPGSDYYRTENVFLLAGAEETNIDHFLPAGDYLCLYYHGSLKQTKQLMPSLFAYAREHQLKITGHPMELCHIDSYETNHEKEYITELELPVKQIKGTSQTL